MKKLVAAFVLLISIAFSLLICPSSVNANDPEDCSTGTTIAGSCVSNYECIVGNDGGLYQQFTICCGYGDGSISCFTTIRFIRYAD
jgi:hypothetical protein